jgi:hypothetical protein
MGSGFILSLTFKLQVFVDLSVVDTAPIRSRVLLSGLNKETPPGSPHKVRQSRDSLPGTEKQCKAEGR